MAHGSSDPVIPQAVAVHSAQALQALGLELEWHSYPMAHQVCAEEIQALAVPPAAVGGDAWPGRAGGGGAGPGARRQSPLDLR
ncbi:hypothetical protein G6F59_017663 [Rhizopus arrhizus]|nr:hypothetical protein G6F59_017663 [Rhizopus arrhizus]